MSLIQSISPFNNFTSSPNLRQPRAIVMINDDVIFWEDIQIATTTFYSADTYEVTIPLYGQSPNINLNYWSSVIDATIKVYIGFPPNPIAYTAQDLELFLVGDIDLMEVDPLNAKVNISGRDLTSRFLDTKTTQTFPNDTASNIAIKLANKHGLTPVVTPTTGTVGRYFTNFSTNATNLLSKQITEWDLLTFIAQQSGFVTFVQDTRLFFSPFPNDEKGSYVLNFTNPKGEGLSPVYDGMDLRFRRSLTLARDVIVKVIVPTNPQTGKSFVKTAKYVRRTRNLPGMPKQVSTPQTYSFIRAGLTEQQAQDQANSLAKNITLQEIVLTTTRPGDNKLRKDGLIKVTGTNTAYDQIYFSESVMRHLSVDSGYNMSITAKNHSVDSQLQL